MSNLLEQLSLLAIVPVIKISDINKALPLAKALCDGGLPCAEITFRTKEGKDAIKIMSEAYPNMLIGAGTVLTTTQVDEAIEAGAKFIVSPGLNPKVVDYCKEKNILMIPGVATPSEIEQAIELGLDTVKFFPAEANGGLKMLKALSGPFGNMKIMPTGGINSGNINEYLGFSKVIACGGSWMVDEKLLETDNYEEITRLTKEAVDKVLGFEVEHIGINQKDEDEAFETAGKFENLFSFKTKVGNSSIFASDSIEIMKNPFLGTCGHMAIKTRDIKRAINYLENKGCTFMEETAKKDDKGNLKAIYMKDEIGGFAIHLIQK